MELEDCNAYKIHLKEYKKVKNKETKQREAWITYHKQQDTNELSQQTPTVNRQTQKVV